MSERLGQSKHALPVIFWPRAGKRPQKYGADSLKSPRLRRGMRRSNPADHRLNRGAVICGAARAAFWRMLLSVTGLGGCRLPVDRCSAHADRTVADWTWGWYTAPHQALENRSVIKGSASGTA